MKHVTEARNKLEHDVRVYVQLSQEDHSVTFEVQDAPIGDVGINGCQATDMLEFVRNLYTSLNDALPCKENEKTIDLINVALKTQNRRTKDRKRRGVEGKYIK